MEQIPSWARAQDMRDILEQIDKNEFKALSPGIGLGSKRPKNSASSQYSAPSLESQRARSEARAKASPQAQAGRPAQAQARRPQNTAAQAVPMVAPHLGLGLRLQAFVIDFFLVLTTVAVAFVAVTVYAKFKVDPGLSWIEQRSVRWLAHTSPIWTLGLIYAVYLVYAIIFKILVGSTCGQSLLGISAKKAVQASHS